MMQHRTFGQRLLGLAAMLGLPTGISIEPQQMRRPELGPGDAPARPTGFTEYKYGSGGNGFTRPTYPPTHDSRGRIGKRNKASSAARRANVYGVQQFAGKPLISYAEHDRACRETLEFFNPRKAS